MSEQKDIERNFSGRGLSKRFPKANILRIEVLSGTARQRYLGGLQRVVDSTIRIQLEASDKNTNNKNDKTFYGFIQNTSGQGYGLTAAWDAAATGGGVLGSAKALAAMGAKKLHADTTKVANAVAEIAQELTGVNANVTGSSSLKRYTGNTLTQDFTVKCGWYLPEQFKLCIHSLRILHKMIYPRKVDDDNFGKNLQKSLETTNHQQGLSTANATESIVNIAKILGDIVPDVALPVAIDAFVAVNKYFGRELAYDPLPVRVCVGQYMDIEPLVITGIDVLFSKETYINTNGRHVPITCSVTIKFKFWMNPSPDLNFLSLCGEEMFGKTRETSKMKQNNNQNNNQKSSVPKSPSFKTAEPSSTYVAPPANIGTTGVNFGR